MRFVLGGTKGCIMSLLTLIRPSSLIANKHEDITWIDRFMYNLLLWHTIPKHRLKQYSTQCFNFAKPGQYSLRSPNSTRCLLDMIQVTDSERNHIIFFKLYNQ